MGNMVKRRETRLQNGGNMGKTRNGACLGMDSMGIRGLIARGSVVNGGCGIISAERRGQ